MNERDDRDGAPHRGSPGGALPTRRVRVRRFPIGSWMAYPLVAVLGLALRIGYATSVSFHKPLDGDSYYFYYWPAVQLAKGHGFVSWESALLDHKFQAALAAYHGPITRQLMVAAAARDYPVLAPDAAHPPGFTGLLAVLYRLGFRSPEAMTLCICVLAGATIILAGCLVESMATRRAGIFAAAGIAFLPAFWIVDTQLLSESLLVFGFVLVPLVVADPDRRWGERLGRVGIVALLPVVFFGGWTVYNLGRLERPVFLSTGYGQTAQVATCDETFAGPWIGYYRMSCRDHYTQPAPTPSGYVDGSVRNATLTRQAWRYTRNHLREVPRVIVAREGRLLGLWNPSQSVRLDHFIDQRGSIAFVWFSQALFWVLTSVGVFGVVVLRRRRTPVFPLLAEVAITMVAAALTFGQTRYRIGIDVCVVVLAAIALDDLWRRFAARRGRPGAADRVEEAVQA